MRNTDEKILSALVSCGSIRAAAAKLGITQKRISDRLKDDDFRERYEAAKGDILRQTVAEITGTLTAAVNTLAGIASDKGAPQSVRVSACDALLRHSLRYLQAVDFENRLQALEEMAKGGRA
jgi:hypothetical protein